MGLLKLRRLARKAGREALILFFAVRHPGTPLSVKLAATAVLAYVVSPIDLIPDLPVIGAIDDLLLLSMGLPMLVRRLPPEVFADSGARADRVLAQLGFGKRSAGAQCKEASADSGASFVSEDVEIVEPARPARGKAARSGRARRGAGISDAKIVSEAPAAKRRRSGGTQRRSPPA